MHIVILVTPVETKTFVEKTQRVQFACIDLWCLAGQRVSRRVIYAGM